MSTGHIVFILTVTQLSLGVAVYRMGVAVVYPMRVESA